jgi:hypothetical protein
VHGNAKLFAIEYKDPRGDEVILEVDEADSEQHAIGIATTKMREAGYKVTDLVAYEYQPRSCPECSSTGNPDNGCAPCVASSKKFVAPQVEPSRA